MLATLGMWVFAVATAGGLDIDIGDLDVFAINVHMLAIVLFNGLLALAIGAATGNRGAALGVTIAVLVIGFLGAGLLPMLEWGKDWVKIFPWYYFNGSEPLYNGVDWEHIAILGRCIAPCSLSWPSSGVNRRDLKGQSVGTTMIDRLRAIPMTKKLADALRRRGARLVHLVQDGLRVPVHAAARLPATCSSSGRSWAGSTPPSRPRRSTVFDQIPEGMGALFELFGGGDIATPEGFVQIETFGMMAPIMVMVVTIAIGAGAVAGEEAKRTMGLLLANPISRSRIIAEKTWTMVLYGTIVGVVAFLGTWLGSIIGDMGIDVWNMASICILVTLVGIVGGALALAIGSASGRKGAAVWGAVGVMVALHVMNSLGEIADNPAWQKLSPFYYYLGSDPLNNGLAWGDAAVLAAIAAVLIALSFPLFQRRDIREKD